MGSGRQRWEQALSQLEALLDGRLLQPLPVADTFVSVSQLNDLARSPDLLPEPCPQRRLLQAVQRACSQLRQLQADLAALGEAVHVHGTEPPVYLTQLGCGLTLAHACLRLLSKAQLGGPALQRLAAAACALAFSTGRAMLERPEGPGAREVAATRLALLGFQVDWITGLLRELERPCAAQQAQLVEAASAIFDADLCCAQAAPAGDGRAALHPCLRLRTAAELLMHPLVKEAAVQAISRDQDRRLGLLAGASTALQHLLAAGPELPAEQRMTACTCMLRLLHHGRLGMKLRGGSQEEQDLAQAVSLRLLQALPSVAAAVRLAIGAGAATISGDRLGFLLLLARSLLPGGLVLSGTHQLADWCRAEQAAMLDRRMQCMAATSAVLLHDFAASLGCPLKDIMFSGELNPATSSIGKALMLAAAAAPAPLLSDEMWEVFKVTVWSILQVRGVPLCGLRVN
ncbi:hypothetical protein ABPG75_012438 [Micractinium tetrahymenae]